MGPRGSLRGFERQKRNDAIPGASGQPTAGCPKEVVAGTPGVTPLTAATALARPGVWIWFAVPVAHAGQTWPPDILFSSAVPGARQTVFRS